MRCGASVLVHAGLATVTVLSPTINSNSVTSHDQVPLNDPYSIACFADYGAEKSVDVEGADAARVEQSLKHLISQASKYNRGATPS